MAIRSPQSLHPRGWKKLSLLYKASLAACDYQIVPITRPEIYQTPAAHQILGIELGDWHLAVKPIEHLRPFTGIPNVFVCDWPYPEFSMKTLEHSPFHDPLKMLGLADVVFCTTEFTTHILRKAGIERAVTLPPAISAPLRKIALHATGRTEFVTVIDQANCRFLLTNIIEGFAKAECQNTEIHLTVCLENYDANLVSELNLHISQNKSTVSVIANDATEAPWADADFLLCADSFSQALSIPMAEAMLTGLPLVATICPANAAILKPGAAVAISAEPREVVAGGKPAAGFMPLTASQVKSELVCDAVLRAASLDRGNRVCMAENAFEIAKFEFGASTFVSRLMKIIACSALKTV